MLLPPTSMPCPPMSDVEAGLGIRDRPPGCTACLWESLLGLKLEVDVLRFTPCIPLDWREFNMHYRYRETLYHITITHAETRHRKNGGNGGWP